MIALSTECTHAKYVKSGRNRNGGQRYKCKDCLATWSDPPPQRPLGTMRIGMDTAEFALRLLVEGNSVRSVERLIGIHRDTICDLILVAGERCQSFHDSMVVDVPVEALEIDEIWSFSGAKQKTVESRGLNPEFGDQWLFTCIERERKMIMAWHMGARDNDDTDVFLGKVRTAVDMSQRFQVSTDGLSTYTNGVPLAFGRSCTFAQLVKKYKSTQEQTRYSPAVIASATKKVRMGNPDYDKISTSFVERMNLNIRMFNRRFTRLTNAFSKSVVHHEAMIAIVLTHYNWRWKHSTIGMTPAMACGLAEHPLSFREILEAV